MHKFLLYLLIICTILFKVSEQLEQPGKKNPTVGGPGDENDVDDDVVDDVDDEDDDDVDDSRRIGPLKGRVFRCNRRGYRRCLIICSAQRRKVCWCARRRFGFPRYECKCKIRICPPFPKK